MWLLFPYLPVLSDLWRSSKHNVGEWFNEANVVEDSLLKSAKNGVHGSFACTNSACALKFPKKKKKKRFILFVCRQEKANKLYRNIMWSKLKQHVLKVSF